MFPTNYGGTPGNIQPLYSDGVTGSGLGIPFTTILTASLANVVILIGAAAGVGAPAGFAERHLLGFITANPTGGSCPLYYAATFYRYTLDPPLETM